MWVVKFRPDYGDESIKVYAEDVDMNDMPLIYIRGIRPKFRSALVVTPEDEAFKELVECEPLIIPFTSIVHIGKLKDESAIVKLGVHRGEKAEARS